LHHLGVAGKEIKMTNYRSVKKIYVTSSNNSKVMKKGLYLIVLIVCAVTMNLKGQQVISSAGGSATGTGIQLSWTVGEPVIETFTGSSAILTQGFHQSKLTITAIDPAVYTDLELSVFPNPVSTSLQLQIKGDLLQKLSYQLYNMEGKTIFSKKVDASPEMINMELYTSGTYLLKIVRDEQFPVKIFKIIKD
jgi:hypothetical protein